MHLFYWRPVLCNTLYALSSHFFISLISIFSSNMIKAHLSKKQLTALKNCNETIKPCTSTVFEQEYFNQTSKVAEISHSCLILACHAMLKDFL